MRSISKTICALKLIRVAMLPLLLSAGACLNAQTASSTISGAVSDMSGAAISGAKVQVKNVDTGVSQTLTTDAEGRYRVPELVLGNYEVEASQLGFQSVLRKGISPTVGQEAIVDLTLPLGQAQQVVTVDERISQVDTSSASLAFHLDQQQISELPLGTARNFTDLINLAPGVAAVLGGGGNNFYGQQANYSVSGSRPTGLGFLIDSTNLTTFQGKSAGSSATGTSLGIEALSQVQVLTNTYTAQFGGNGIVMNAASKSGTNSFHGSAYTFLGNSALNSRGEFDVFVAPGQTTAQLPPSRTIVAGGSVGGPIKKDKMFFFVNQEVYRQGGSQTQTNQNLPDANAHNGYLPCSVATTYTCDPATKLALVGFAPGIQPMMALLPNATTNIVNGLGTEYQVNPIANHDNYTLGRIDYTISDKDGIFLRMIREDAYRLTAPGIGVFTEKDSTGNWFATVEERHIVSSSIVNLARISFLRPQELGTQNSPNFPALQLIPGSPVSTSVVIPSGNRILGPNQSLPFNLTQDGYQGMDDVIWTHGSHNIKFGVAYTATQDFTSNVNGPGGTLQFNSLLTFLQGSPSSFNAPLPGKNYPNRDMVERLITPYIHDEWKVSRRLTLNMGVRYEWAANPSERRNNLYNFTSPLTDSTWVQIPAAFLNNPTNKNFAPRFGFAYDPFADHKTSIRGGFGLFYDVMTGHIVLPSYWGSYPFASTQITGTTTAPIPWPNPYAAIANAVAPPPTVNAGFLYSDKSSTPYAMQYNLNIQRELMQGTILQVAYVGAGGRHLLGTIERNPPQIVNGAFGTLATNGSTTPNPRLNLKLGALGMRSEWGTSNYNALQVGLTRRFTSHLSAQLSYSYSKSLDYGSSFSQDTAVGNNVNTENPYDTRNERGRSTFDRTHVLRINSTYELPFAQNALVKGWKVAGIWSQNTGAPTTIYTGFDRAGLAGNSGGVNRPNLAPGCSADPVIGTIAAWFDKNCYVLQPVGTIGNVGRTTVVGPAFKNLAFSLLKDTKVPQISETFNVQFRAEFANIFNHPNLNLNANGGSNATQVFLNGNVNPDGSLGTRNPIAGTITNTVGSARQITLALKLIF